MAKRTSILPAISSTKMYLTQRRKIKSCIRPIRTFMDLWWNILSLNWTAMKWSGNLKDVAEQRTKIYLRSRKISGEKKMTSYYAALIERRVVVCYQGMYFRALSSVRMTCIHASGERGPACRPTPRDRSAPTLTWRARQPQLTLTIATRAHRFTLLESHSVTFLFNLKENCYGHRRL